MGRREMRTGRGWGRCFGDARGGQLSGAVPEDPARCWWTQNVPENRGGRRLYLNFRQDLASLGSDNLKGGMVGAETLGRKRLWRKRTCRTSSSPALCLHPLLAVCALTSRYWRPLTYSASAWVWSLIDARRGSQSIWGRFSSNADKIHLRYKACIDATFCFYQPGEKLRIWVPLKVQVVNPGLTVPKAATGGPQWSVQWTYPIWINKWK